MDGVDELVGVDGRGQIGVAGWRLWLREWNDRCNRRPAVNLQAEAPVARRAPHHRPLWLLVLAAPFAATVRDIVEEVAKTLR